jgi:cobalt/nickel transport system permease protein
MIGTLFAVLMLGIPYGILSMISVLLIQTVFFADGGLKEIGANSLNMVYAAVLPLMIYLSVVKKKFSDFKFYKNKTLIFVLSILSVVSASIFCVTQLYFSGLSDIKHISDSMIKVHILIGLGEGLITISLILIINALLKKFPSKPEYVFFFILIMTAIAITPAASSMPDGLEWVAQRYNFHNENAETIKLFFSDYSVGFIKNEYLSTAVSGIIGTIITFIFTYTGSLILKKSKE